MCNLRARTATGVAKRSQPTRINGCLFISLRADSIKPVRIFLPLRVGKTENSAAEAVGRQRRPDWFRQVDGGFDYDGKVFAHETVKPNWLDRTPRLVLRMLGCLPWKTAVTLGL